jgi:predicted phage terminase large subunit-like protein
VYFNCQHVDELKRNNHKRLHGYLWLWARELYKTTILNLGQNLQNILEFPKSATLILSNNNSRAKAFLRPVGLIMENNDALKDHFDDVLFKNPQREAKPWSIDNGYVTRQHDPGRREPTIFASGIENGGPTGVHCDYICRDDIVDEGSVETVHQMEKTRKEYELTLPLGRNVDVPGMPPAAEWYIATRYHDKDLTGELLRNGDYIPDIMPWHMGDGTTPRVHTYEKIQELKRRLSPYIFACQYELNPTADSKRRFSGRLVYYNQPPAALDYVILCDPAGGFKEKREHNPDYTAMGVVGRDELGNEYFIDGLYDRIDLHTRMARLFQFVKKYRVNNVWYEKSSMNADISEIERMKVKTGLFFNLNPFKPLDNKQYRIERNVMPRIENGILQFPNSFPYTNSEGEHIDLIHGVLRKEMEGFPLGEHDDFLDMLAQLAETDPYGRGSEPLDEALNQIKRQPRMSKKKQADDCMEAHIYI